MPHFTLTFAQKGTFTLTWLNCPTLPDPFAKIPHSSDLPLVKCIDPKLQTHQSKAHRYLFSLSPSAVPVQTGRSSETAPAGRWPEQAPVPRSLPTPSSSSPFSAPPSSSCARATSAATMDSGGGASAVAMGPVPRRPCRPFRWSLPWTLAAEEAASVLTGERDITTERCSSFGSIH